MRQYPGFERYRQRAASERVVGESAESVARTSWRAAPCPFISLYEFIYGPANPSEFFSDRKRH